MNSNDQSIKSLNEEILKGNISIGNKNEKIWKNIQDNISMMNDEHINDIPQKIAINNSRIKNIDAEIQMLKKRKKQLIKENNKYLQRPFGYYIYKDKIPKLKEITSNIIKLEDNLSLQVHDLIDKKDKCKNINDSLQAHDLNEDLLKEESEKENEFINLNDSLQCYEELHHDKYNEFKQYIISSKNSIEQIKKVIFYNIDKLEKYEDEQYKIIRFISSISKIQNNDNIEYSTIRNNYFNFIEYFKSIYSIEFLKNEEKELLKPFIFNINEFFNENYLISSSSKIGGVSLSLILNICSIPPSIIDKLKSMNGNTFISCDLRNEFKHEDFESFEYFEYLDLLYCQKMVKGRLFPFQNHQSIKSIEDLENEFIDMSEKEEEYIDDNRFIISEHIKTAKKLIAINIKHIGKEKYDENANFDDLIFKMKLKRLLKQFEDIEIKYDELNIEQQNANNDKQKQKEEKEIEDNYFCIKGLSLIIDINKIIKQLNTCFIAYTSDKSIKYENEILENYMNRKYKEVLDEFEDIYSKIIFRKEEKQRKEKEKELNKTNTMMNIHQIDRNENYISILNNQCKIC